MGQTVSLWGTGMWRLRNGRLISRHAGEKLEAYLGGLRLGAAVYSTIRLYVGTHNDLPFNGFCLPVTCR